MGQFGYDYKKGMANLAKARANLDQFTMEVIELHAALEIELGVVLKALLPRGGVVLSGKGKLGFGEKVSVLNAAWIGREETIDALVAVLVAFINLRNAVAHTDHDNVAKSLTNLREVYRTINHEADAEAPLLDIAQGICAMIGDGPTAEDMQQHIDEMAAKIAPAIT